MSDNPNLPFRCPKCGAPKARRPGYCSKCHAEYMRENRPKHSDLPPEARSKATTRAYAREYQKREKLVPQPCADCGSPETEKHHHDYAKPLEVMWLCRKCHLQRHT